MSSSVIAFFVIIFIPEAKHWISSYSLIALTEVSGGKFGHWGFRHYLKPFFFHLFILQYAEWYVFYDIIGQESNHH